MSARAPVRFTATFALVGAIILSGCLAGDAPVTPAALVPVLDRVVPANYSVPLSIDPDHPGAEPSIRVGPDGTIWITNPYGHSPTDGDTLWRSTDGGKSFEYLGSPDPLFGGGDSDIAIDSGNRIWQTGLWSQCVSVATSTNGKGWSMNPLMCGVPFDDRNWIETYGKDVAYLTFGSGLGAARGTMLLRAEVVNGVPVMANALRIPDSGQYQWPGNLAVDPTSGAVYVAYLTFDDKAYVFRSTDGGKSAVKLPVAERQGDTFDSFAVVATDRAGNVYMTWSEREKETSTTGIYLASSTTQGDNWSAPVRVNGINDTATAVFPWIAAGDAGRVAVGYYATNATGKSAEEVDGAWHVYVATSLDALSANATWTEARISTDPIIQGSICTSGTGCAPGTRGLLDYFQIALDPQGYVHAAWAMMNGKTPNLMYGRQLDGPSLLLAPATPETAANATAPALPRVPVTGLG